ncbi:MAG: type III pantothenate kinase [Rhodospirillaceae bacterium]
MTMKVLAIDAGNTRVKWGLYADGVWAHRSWAATAEISSLAEGLRVVDAPSIIVVSNVAGAVARDAIDRAVARYAAPTRWLVASAELCGVKSSYANPEQLGSDRWAALIGARHRYAAPCVVVNAGTTMTVDALSEDGLFLGGCIVPGLDLMQKALAHNTAQLARAPGRFLYFPDNTGDAIMSGAINALAGAVDRMMTYVQETAEREPLVVLSGGAADMLEPHLRGRVERVDNLVLEGLVQIALQEQ